MHSDNDDLELPEPAGWRWRPSFFIQDYIVLSDDIGKKRAAESVGIEVEAVYTETQVRAILADRQRRAQAAEPVAFLCGGTRFKLAFSDRGKVSALANYRDELDGRWVALVAAENDCHLKRAAPAEVTEEKVMCQCGDIYPADSFAAGFMAAHGSCQNCAAADQGALEAALGGGHGD